MSLYDFMQSIYKKYGMYLNTLLNFNFEGAAGMQKMQDMPMIQCTSCLYCCDGCPMSI